MLWLFALAMLVASYGPGATLPRMGWFFTKAALLTFGGAYAVLPYVYQGAVETYGWLTPVQMIDGLALGETTPGPLIMVVAFVGFVGGWTKMLFGADSLALAGIAGASVATFFTFLPSFLFILAGGPLVETTHGQLRFTAPLTGITAAVVGVIVNLARVLRVARVLAEWLDERIDDRRSRRAFARHRHRRRARAVPVQGGRDPRDTRLRRGRYGGRVVALIAPA